MTDLNLSHIYRGLNQTCTRYTWRKGNPLKLGRLDFFLITNTMADLIKECDIKAGYRSSHSITTIDVLLNNFFQGKGTWKFNNSLLLNPGYLNMVTMLIKLEVTQYAVLVYSTGYIGNSPDNISLTVNDEIFLEVLLLRIWRKTKKVCFTNKKRS